MEKFQRVCIYEAQTFFKHTEHLGLLCHANVSKALIQLLQTQVNLKQKSIITKLELLFGDFCKLSVVFFLVLLYYFFPC